MRVIAGVIAANVILLAILLWATTERLPVTVVASGGEVTAQVGSATVVADSSEFQSGKVGFFLQGADPNTAVPWPGTTPASRVAPSISDWIYRLAAESAWTNVRVTSVGTGSRKLLAAASGRSGLAWQPQFGDWFHHPLGGQATPSPGLIDVGSSSWSSYKVQADLLRPRNAAGILVLSPDGVNGMLLYFRPEDRDVMWYRVVDGQWNGPVASAPYRAFHQSYLASIQDVVRLALGGIPGAIAFIVGALALGMIASRGRVTNGVRPVDPAKGRSSDRLQRGGQVVGMALILGASLALTLYVADRVLQAMPHVQDSVAYLFQAKTYALGRLWVPVPQHPEFFTHEFILMYHGRWFSKYPPGWPMILALGVLAGAPWVVGPICGTVALFFVYRLGREIYRPRVGILAAALGLVSPFFIFLSSSMMAHAAGFLFAVLFVWLFWRTTRSNTPFLASALAGCAFGMGFLVRPYTELLIAIPFALYALIEIIRQPRDGFRRYLPAAGAAFVFGVAFCAYNAYFTGNPFYPPQQLWWPFDKVGFGPGHGPFGFTPLDALNNTSRNLSELLSHTFGWPTFLTLSLAFVPFVLGRAKRWDWLLAGSFVALVAGYGAWWADGIMYGPRFYFEGIGFLLLLTARGVEELVGIIQRGGEERKDSFWYPLGRGQRLASFVAAYGLVIALVAFNAVFYFPGQWQLYHGYNYVNHSKLAAVAAAGIHHAVVFADVGPAYAWWEYGMVFSANDPLLHGDVIFARDLGAVKDRELMADFPGRSFYRLNGTVVKPFNLQTN